MQRLRTADRQNVTILTDNILVVQFYTIGGDCPGKTDRHRDILARLGCPGLANVTCGFIPDWRKRRN